MVSTMAFNTGSADSTVAYPITITQSGTEHITDVKVLPYKGVDGIYFIITVDTAKSMTFYLQLVDSSGNAIDVNDYTTACKVESDWDETVSWDADYEALKIDAASTTGFTNVKVRIYKSGTNVYETTTQVVLIETAHSNT